MFADILPLAIGIAALLFCAYLFVRAYRPHWLYAQRDSFVVRPPPMGPPVVEHNNVPVAPIPAPAPPVKVDPPEEERVVAPAGPAAPNAAPPVDTPASISPEAAPVDPYDDRNMEAPIEDSMRHPELSFGPGVENSGMNRLATSGVGSARVASSESPFSPDFAQNGGKFMGDVTANDLTKDDRFASF